MTGIILVLIGVLLAALAALFVVFYGGEAFNSGNTKAAAATIVNMGENVKHASDLYRATKGSDADGVDALVSQGYLSRAPEPASLGRAETEWRTIRPVNAVPFRGYVIDGVDPQVCMEINRQTANSDEVVHAAGVNVGCILNGEFGYFFVKVG